MQLVIDLRRHMALVTEELTSAAFLRQRFDLAVQWGNAAAILDSISNVYDPHILLFFFFNSILIYSRST